jgi:hypothetical protein
MNNQPDLKIELLRAEDIPAVLDTFAEWDKTPEQFEDYLAEQERGERTVFLAWLDVRIVGALNIRWQTEYAPPQQQWAQIDNLDVIADQSFITIGEVLYQTYLKTAEQREVHALFVKIDLWPLESVEQWLSLHFYPAFFDEIDSILFIRIADRDLFHLSLRFDWLFSGVDPIDVVGATPFDLRGHTTSILGWCELVLKGFLPNDKYSIVDLAKTTKSQTRKIDAIMQMQVLYFQLYTKNQTLKGQT